jgi:hypothetical protein
MFSGVRRHINATTIVAVFALVFAMTGGAFAVTSKGGSSDKAIVAKSKAKSKTVRGPSGPRGATGPVGPAGAQGAQGAQGAAGAQGPKGESGAAGATGAKGETGPQGAQGKEGREGKEGPEGPAGPSGTTKTLESGETETGTWAALNFSSLKEIAWYIPISFTIPLKLGLEGKDVHYIIVGHSTTECPGSAELPKAAAGQFCLYQGEEEVGSQFEVFTMSPPGGVKKNDGTGTSGVIVGLKYEGPAEASEVTGAWAVTAP